MGVRQRGRRLGGWFYRVVERIVAQRIHGMTPELVVSGKVGVSCYRIINVQKDKAIA